MRVALFCNSRKQFRGAWFDSQTVDDQGVDGERIGSGHGALA